jgi:hypothetical protein
MGTTNTLQSAEDENKRERVSDNLLILCGEQTNKQNKQKQ